MGFMCASLQNVGFICVYKTARQGSADGMDPLHMWVENGIMAVLVALWIHGRARTLPPGHPVRALWCREAPPARAEAHGKAA